MIIDSHIHTNFNDEKLIETAKWAKIDFSLNGLEKEMQENKINYAISIQIDLQNIEKKAQNSDENKINQKKTNKNIFDVAYINPYLDQKSQLNAIESLIIKKAIIGIKIYLGYYHFYPSDPYYLPFYILGEKYQIPIIFHTGDTYSMKAKVKYAHPLLIDEIAVDYPNTKFLIAHFGHPWVWDAAEVIYKNQNVYADLSGWFTCDKIESISLSTIKAAMNYCDFQNLIYGSDWPLVNMNSYLTLIDSIVPENQKENVFWKTAKKIFPIG